MLTFYEFEDSKNRDNLSSEVVNKLKSTLSDTGLDHYEINIMFKLFRMIVACMKSPVTKPVVVKMVKELKDVGGFDEFSFGDLEDELNNLAFKCQSPVQKFLNSKIATKKDDINNPNKPEVVPAAADHGGAVSEE